MTTKQEVLAYVKQNGFVYPKFKVIFGFGLVGSAIGSVLFILPILLFGLFLSIFENPNNIFEHIKNFAISFLMMPIIALFGVAVGGIPALLTGIYLAVKEFIVIDKKDYLRVFSIGFLTTAICALLAVMFGNQQPNMQNSIFDVFIIPLPFAIIGGISSMICGKLFLPRLPKEFEK